MRSWGAINVIYGSPTGLSGWDDHYFGQNTSGVAGIAHVDDEFGVLSLWEISMVTATTMWLWDPHKNITGLMHAIVPAIHAVR